MTERRALAWILWAAAKKLPPADRQQFGEFLFGLAGAEPPTRRIHSWKRKGKRTKRKRRPKTAAKMMARWRPEQLDLPLD